jgi:hypothetical protein
LLVHERLRNQYGRGRANFDQFALHNNCIIMV